MEQRDGYRELWRKSQGFGNESFYCRLVYTLRERERDFVGSNLLVSLSFIFSRQRKMNLFIIFVILMTWRIFIGECEARFINFYIL